jgi:hypothetical protein
VARPPVQRQSRRRCRVRAHPRLRAQFAGEPVTGPEAWLYPVVRPS